MSNYEVSTGITTSGAKRPCHSREPAHMNATEMAGEQVAGIGALLKPNKYSILKFVDLHPGGAAKLSGLVTLCAFSTIDRCLRSLRSLICAVRSERTRAMGRGTVHR